MIWLVYVCRDGGCRDGGRGSNHTAILMRCRSFRKHSKAFRRNAPRHSTSTSTNSVTSTSLNDLNNVSRPPGILHLRSWNSTAQLNRVVLWSFHLLQDGLYGEIPGHVFLDASTTTLPFLPPSLPTRNSQTCPYSSNPLSLSTSDTSNPPDTHSPLPLALPPTSTQLSTS